MEHADGDAPIEGARQPDLDDDEQIKYIKHKVSVFVDDRSPGYCSVLPCARARARARSQHEGRWSACEQRGAFFCCLWPRGISADAPPLLLHRRQGELRERNAVLDNRKHHVDQRLGGRQGSVVSLALRAHARGLARHQFVSASLHLLPGESGASRDPSLDGSVC
jgi:hypothetical protein